MSKNRYAYALQQSTDQTNYHCISIGIGADFKVQDFNLA